MGSELQLLGVGVEISLDVLEVVEAELVLDDKSIILEVVGTELELVDVELVVDGESVALLVDDMEVLLVVLAINTTVLM